MPEMGLPPTFLVILMNSLNLMYFCSKNEQLSRQRSYFYCVYYACAGLGTCCASCRWQSLSSMHVLLQGVSTTFRSGSAYSYAHSESTIQVGFIFNYG